MDMPDTRVHTQKNRLGFLGKPTYKTHLKISQF